MKLKYEFVIDNLDGKTVAIPVNEEISKMIMLNSTASFAMELLKNDITKEELIEKMLNNYDVDKNELIADVENFLKVLKENRLIIE